MKKFNRFRKQYSRRELIFSPDNELTKIFMLQEGFVRVYKLSPDGHEFTVRLLGVDRKNGFSSGSELPLLLNLTPKDSYVEALGSCTILKIPKSIFIDEVLLNRNAVVELYGQWQQCLQSAENRLVDLAFLNVDARVAKTLVKLAEDFGKTDNEQIKLPFYLSQAYLADYIGASRPSTSIALNKLKKEKMIDYTNKQLRILDIEQLKDYCEV